MTGGRVEKDLSRFLGAADMSDRWDDGGDDYDVWWWGVDRYFYGEVDDGDDDNGDDDDDGDDDGNKFFGAPDMSDRWVRRI